MSRSHLSLWLLAALTLATPGCALITALGEDPEETPDPAEMSLGRDMSSDLEPLDMPVDGMPQDMVVIPPDMMMPDMMMPDMMMPDMMTTGVFRDYASCLRSCDPDDVCVQALGPQGQQLSEYRCVSTDVVADRCLKIAPLGSFPLGDLATLDLDGLPPLLAARTPAGVVAFTRAFDDAHAIIFGGEAVPRIFKLSADSPPLNLLPSGTISGGIFPEALIPLGPDASSLMLMGRDGSGRGVASSIWYGVRLNTGATNMGLQRAVTWTHATDQLFCGEPGVNFGAFYDLPPQSDLRLAGLFCSTDSFGRPPEYVLEGVSGVPVADTDVDTLSLQHSSSTSLTDGWGDQNNNRALVRVADVQRALDNNVPVVWGLLRDESPDQPGMQGWRIAQWELPPGNDVWSQRRGNTIDLQGLVASRLTNLPDCGSDAQLLDGSAFLRINADGKLLQAALPYQRGTDTSRWAVATIDLSKVVNRTSPCPDGLQGCRDYAPAIAVRCQDNQSPRMLVDVLSVPMSSIDASVDLAGNLPSAVRVTAFDGMMRSNPAVLRSTLPLGGAQRDALLYMPARLVAGQDRHQLIGRRLTVGRQTSYDLFSLSLSSQGVPLCPAQ